MNHAVLLTQLQQHSLLSDAQVQAIASRPLDGAADLSALLDEWKLKGALTEYQIEEILQGNVHKLQIGQYLLLEPIGAGGFGQVFKARHLVMDRIVALKLISPERMDDPLFHQRFLKEVRATTKLHHPNIVLAYDAQDVNGQLYLAMELIEGLTLGQLVRERGNLSITLAVNMLLQTAKALKYAHELGMVHRDIKPANLLVPDAGLSRLTGSTDEAVILVKVVDFGLARSQPSPGSSLSSGLLDGNFLGTPDYVAPEQAQNPRAADHRADLYSLGCTFYHALTGQKPFRGNTPLAVVMQHMTNFAPPIESLRPEVPPVLAGILRKLMEKKRELRFSSADALIAELNRFLGKGSSPLMILPSPAITPVSSPGARHGNTDASDTSRSESGYPTTAILPELSLGNTAVLAPLVSVAPRVDLPPQEKKPILVETISPPVPSPLPDAPPDMQAVQELPAFWQTWLQVLEDRIHGKPIGLNTGEYKILHARVVRGLQSRTLIAKPDQREHLRDLAALVAPWLNLHILLQTEPGTLENLWQRCRERGITVGLYQRPSHWLAWLVVLSLLVNLIPFVLSMVEKKPDLSFRQRLTWTEVTRFVEVHPVLCLSLLVPTAALVLYGFFRHVLRRG